MDKVEIQKNICLGHYSNLIDLIEINYYYSGGVIADGE